MNFVFQCEIASGCINFEGWVILLSRIFDVYMHNEELMLKKGNNKSEERHNIYKHTYVYKICVKNEIPVATKRCEHLKK